jgi:O-antigen/teichoic acid export membrane protein
MVQRSRSFKIHSVIKHLPTACGVIARAIATLSVSKVVSAEIGPTQFLFYGQLILGLGISITIASFGLGNAFYVYFGNALIPQRTQTVTSHIPCSQTAHNLAYTISLFGGVTVGISVALAILAFRLSDRPVVFAACAFCYCVSAPLIQASAAKRAAQGQFGAQQLLATSPALLTLALMALASQMGKLNPTNAACIYCITSLPAAVYIYIFDKDKVCITRLSVEKSLRYFAKYIPSGVTTPLIGSVATLMVTNIISQGLPPAEAGKWYSVWKLSEAYFGLISAIIVSAFLPAMSRDPSSAIKRANAAFLAMIVMYAPFGLSISFFAQRTFSVFFSPEYGIDLPSLAGQAAGDILKAYSFSRLLGMMAIQKPSVTLQSELVFSAVFPVLCFILLKYIGISGALIAYFLAYLILSAYLTLKIRLIGRSGNSTH